MSDRSQRLPETELIEDDDVRAEVRAAIDDTDIVAPYFWTAPAASTYNHHNPYCCNDRGLWIHTKMAFAAYERLVQSYHAQGLITEYEVDLGRAAILLHDGQKYGDVYDPDESTASDHDLIMADLIRDDTDLDERVADAIAAHMGPWYDGPEPLTALQRCVHMADMAASTKNGTFGVYKPHDMIRDLYPSLPEAVFD